MNNGEMEVVLCVHIYPRQLIGHGSEQMVVSLLLADLKLEPSLGVRLRLSTCGEEPRIWTECWCYTEARPPPTVHHTGLVHPATHSGSALASPLNTPTSTLCLYISKYLHIYTSAHLHIYTSTHLHIYISTYLHIYVCLHSHLRSSVQWLLTSVCCAVSGPRQWVGRKWRQRY